MKHYTERDIIGQGVHYANHVQAMTAEGLHAKSDIAAELAHRDIEIHRLRIALRGLRLSADVARRAKPGHMCDYAAALSSVCDLVDTALAVGGER